MTIYNVHVFTIVRVKFENIEADTMEAAAELCKQGPPQVHFGQLFQSRRHAKPETEWAEEHSHFLVDVVGDTEYIQSRWLDLDGKDLKT